MNKQTKMKNKCENCYIEVEKINADAMFMISLFGWVIAIGLCIPILNYFILRALCKDKDFLTRKEKIFIKDCMQNKDKEEENKFYY